MNMKHLLLSGILLPALIAISFALNQGLIQAVVGNGDVSLTVGSSTLPNGQVIELTGVLDFATDQTSYIHSVTLVVDGPDSQDLNVALPLEEVTSLNLIGAPGVTGEFLEVSVDFDGVVDSGSTLPGSTIPDETFEGGTLPGGTLPSDSCSGGTLPGTLPGGTLPGSTLPGGKGFIGVGGGGTITYSIDWKPSLVGSYQGYLAVIASGVNGCTLILSDAVEFSVTAAPPNPEDGDTPQVTLCHVPPGNPAAAHVITVGAPAVAAHLRHGDYISNTCQPPDDTELHTGSHDDSDDDDGSHSDGDTDFAKKGKGKKSGHDARVKFKEPKGQNPSFGGDSKPPKKGHDNSSDSGNGAKNDDDQDDGSDEAHQPDASVKPSGNDKDKERDGDKDKKPSEKSRGKPSHDGKDKKPDKKDDDKKPHGKPSQDDKDKKPGKSEKAKGKGKK